MECKILNEPLGRRGTVRPVGVIVDGLSRIADEDWARYAFSRDPLNAKFNDAQRYFLAQKAIACGEAEAEACIQRYGLVSAEKLAKEMGVKVDCPIGSENMDRVLFAQFCPPNQISVYMDTVKKAEQFLDEPAVHKVLGNPKIFSLLLFHELFHFVEEQHKREIWTQSYQIELWALGPLRYRSKVAALSEIGAMAFAKKMTGISCSPYVLDAFLVYGYSSETANVLYEEMLSLAGREIY